MTDRFDFPYWDIGFDGVDDRVEVQAETEQTAMILAQAWQLSHGRARENPKRLAGPHRIPSTMPINTRYIPERRQAASVAVVA